MLEINLNYDWFFSYSRSGKRNEESAPKRVHLPHDFSIGTKRSELSLMGGEGGYFQGGIGIYTKTFRLNQDIEGKIVRLCIDGAYQNCEVFVNGSFVKLHHYGYTKFYMDITKYINAQTENEIKIIINNTALPNSRGYSGSGIFRKVSIMINEQLHIIPDGVQVYTKELSKNRAIVHTKAIVKNSYDDRNAYGMLVTEITGRDNKTIATGKNVILKPGEVYEMEADITIDNPTVWSVNVPQLYTVVNKVTIGGNIIDKTETKFGIRTLELSADEGLRLNGRGIKLRGCNIHQDNGVIGAVSFPAAEERKVKLLKEMGYNAVRIVNNPPSPYLLDACDKLGMLVIEEFFDVWNIGKNFNDYHMYFASEFEEEIKNTVKRDLNHPSVILWSIGNEVIDDKYVEGMELAKKMVNIVKGIDETRKIMCSVTKDCIEEFCNVLDVIGLNNAHEEYAEYFRKYPDRLVIGTKSYPGKMFETWNESLKYSNVIGDFSWTGIDYLGDAGLGRVIYENEDNSELAAFPYHISGCGDYDICGFIKPQGMYRRIMNGSDDTPYIAVLHPKNYNKIKKITEPGWDELEHSWDFKGYEGKKTKIYVYSNADEIELRINDRIIDKKKVGESIPYLVQFEADYMSGFIEAVTYKNGVKGIGSRLNTAKQPSEIRINLDKFEYFGNYNDLVYAECQVLDSDNRLVTEPVMLEVSVEGEAKIQGTGNADFMSLHNYKLKNVETYKGKALIVLRTKTKGMVVLNVKANVNHQEICGKVEFFTR